MAIRKIITEGEDILRKHCRPVGEVTPHIKLTLEDMVETMRAAGGVGLAAPQIGVMRRMFVAEPEPGKVYYMVDPEITNKEGCIAAEEGCLSVPGLVGTVERPEIINIKAIGLDGEQQTFELHEFEARVMCHECDHLDGILYTDKAENVHAPGQDSEDTE